MLHLLAAYFPLQMQNAINIDATVNVHRVSTTVSHLKKDRQLYRQCLAAAVNTIHKQFQSIRHQSKKQ